MPTGQVHWLLEQVSFFLQAIPQPPQLVTVLVATHVPLHADCPVGHTQALLTQVSPALLQVIPQPPQLLAVLVATHALLHNDCPVGQTQELLTQVSPVEVQSAAVAQPAWQTVAMQARPPEQSDFCRQPIRQTSVASSQILPAPHVASWRHPSKQVRVVALQIRPAAQSVSCAQPTTHLELDTSQYVSRGQGHCEGTSVHTPETHTWLAPQPRQATGPPPLPMTPPVAVDVPPVEGAAPAEVEPPAELTPPPPRPMQTFSKQVSPLLQVWLG